MANISDVIADYILSTLEGEDSLCVSRNGLASFFNCSPSQINYVISTRFNLDRGYVVESRRGGGGYLIIMKLQSADGDYLARLLQSEIGDTISYHRVADILDRLKSDEVITEREMDIILSLMNDKTLFFPESTKDRLRSAMLKSALTELAKNNNK